MCVRRCTDKSKQLAGKLAEEFLLIKVVLESFAAIDKDHWNFVVELAAELDVAVNVNFLPREPSTTRQLREALLHHFAQVASLAGVHDDGAQFGHSGEGF